VGGGGCRQRTRISLTFKSGASELCMRIPIISNNDEMGGTKYIIPICEFNYELFRDGRD